MICQSRGLGSAELRGDKKSQVVRLVNPSEVEVHFAIRQKSSEADSFIDVSPKTGTILPRNFIDVVVRNRNNKEGRTEARRLYLLYWRRSKTRRKTSGHSLVPINVMACQDDSPRLSNKTLSMLLRISRSILLVAIIIYNLILIKLYSYGQ